VKHTSCPIPWKNLDLRGEIARRARLSFQRLEDYSPAFTLCGNRGWPGDREGRAILGQVLLSQTLHEESRQTGALLDGLPDGILGEPLDHEAIHEQQVMGHHWLLRAFCEIHAVTGREEMLDRMRRIVDELYLPLRGKWNTYPINPERRDKTKGAQAGTMVDGVVDGWKLSSDIGTAFIALDGLTQAYEVEPRPELGELIEEGIQRFLEIDPVKLGCQTHATLSCLRALLRWSRIKDRPDLVQHSAKIFDIYLSIATTEHHHNWNWFGQPTWTEPCAVVDAFMVALELWRATGNNGRLATAQEILFTGLSRQNNIGGYGTDHCVGANGLATVRVHSYEAPHCCTMRGAEGWARIAESCWHLAGDRVYLPWQSDSTALLRLPAGTWKVRQESRYPEDGVSTLTIEQAPEDGILELALYAAPWVDRSSATSVAEWDGDWAIVRFPARPGATVRIDLPFGLRRQPALGEMRETHVSFRHGPSLLGLRGESSTAEALGQPKPLGRARYRTADGSVLEPIGEATWHTEQFYRETQYQVLFRE
jgi:uncharacterized protein